MSTVKANRVQIGQSATATQNFSLEQPAVPDGTVKLVRGNAGSGSQDILTVDASGNLKPGVLGNYASDSAAATGGVPIGGLYHSSGAVKVRVS